MDQHTNVNILSRLEIQLMAVVEAVRNPGGVFESVGSCLELTPGFVRRSHLLCRCVV